MKKLFLFIKFKSIYLSEKIKKYLFDNVCKKRQKKKKKGQYFNFLMNFVTE